MQTAPGPAVGSAAESEKPNLEERSTMKNSTKLLALVLVAAAALFGAVQPAQAQSASGETAVSVNLNGIVILYYYSSVNVTMPSNLLGPSAVAAAAANPTAVAVATGAEATLVNPTSAPPIALNAVNLDLLNAWSVRSLNLTGANTQVTISGAANTMTNGGSGEILITDRQVRRAGGGFATPSISFPSAGTFVTPQTGDVRLVLNMTGVVGGVGAGSYTGGNYILEALNI